MTLTLNEIEAVIQELDRILVGGRLSGAFLEDDETLVLAVRRKSAEHFVLISARHHLARIHLTEHSPATGHERRRPAGSLADVLNHLAGAEIRRVKRWFEDRVVAMTFMLEGEKRTLLFECSGQHPNVFLLDPRGVILAILKPTRSRKRDLRPGLPYAQPLHRATDPMGSLRFLGSEGGLSAEIEAYYDGMVTGRPRRLVSVTPPERRKKPSRP
ncbi:MAG: hypothetical protein GXP54_07495 [Deltaproteobacteria bacterium]|nr:hypothetical protein [Deltaproteobacteria bacterium]